MRKSVRLYRISAFILAVAGIIFNMAAYPHYAELFSYFTLQSNVLCTVMLGHAMLRSFGRNREAGTGEVFFRGLCTVCITLTFLVYHFALRPENLTPATLFDNMTNISTLFAHYIVPAAVITDYLLFFPKRRFRMYYPPLWLVYPVVYLCYVFLYSAAGGTFAIDGKISPVPYFFLDSAVVGSSGVVLWICLMATGFTLLSYIFVFADRFMPYNKYNI